MEGRERHVYMAKLAEKAERYEGKLLDLLLVLRLFPISGRKYLFGFIRHFIGHMVYFDFFMNFLF